MRSFIEAALATAVLLFIAPILVLVTIAIVLDSPGNPFYGARRIGLRGRGFRMWKFRTMVVNAAQTGPAITYSGDRRITRVGRLLRRTKLDEIPQLFNVVLGDMSLVGPRPETPSMVACYTAEQRAVLAVKPGVTGRVQIASGEESDQIPASVDPDLYYREHLMDRKLAADLEYLRERTLFSDIRVLFATAAYVLRSFAR